MVDKEWGLSKRESIFGVYWMIVRRREK